MSRSATRVASIRYDFSIPAFLATRLAGRVAPAVLASGRIPGLGRVEAERRALPGVEWLRLRPRLCGICGSDMALLTGHSSPALSPFASFPAVLGHEIVADVAEVGATVAGIGPGDRVVVDPFISCNVRELEPCGPCARGEPSLCTRTAEGKLAPGMLIGFCRDLPGGWSEEMIVHRTQVHAVPAALDDRTAVLVEPLSVAMHAVLKARPGEESRVLILGGGTVGLCVLASIRLLGLGCPVTVVTRYPFQAELARQLGADTVVAEGEGPDKGAGRAAVTQTGAKAYRPLRGRAVYAGGFDWVYDCVGSPRSLDDSLRVAGPGGRVVLVGCAGEIPRLDWSFVWARELQITGTYGYAREPSAATYAVTHPPDGYPVDGAPHTMDLAMRLLAERPDYPLADLITHRYPLAGWRAAIAANLARGRHRAIKVVFECQAAAP